MRLPLIKQIGGHYAGCIYQFSLLQPRHQSKGGLSVGKRVGIGTCNVTAALISHAALDIVVSESKGLIRQVAVDSLLPGVHIPFFAAVMEGRFAALAFHRNTIPIYIYLTVRDIIVIKAGPV